MLKWLASRFGPATEPAAPMLERAQLLRWRGDFEAARRICREILHEAPDDAGAMAMMAAVAVDERNFSEGQRWAAQALAADPRCVAAHFALGRLHEGAERYAEAEQSYRRVVQLEPGHSKGHTNLGCMLHIQGRLDEAASCYRMALRIEPDQPEARRNHALIVGDFGQLRQTVDGFERHVASNPMDAAARHQLANLYVHVGRHADALAAYEQAIALEPEQAEFHFARAQLLLLLGRYSEGWQEYEWRWRLERFNRSMLRFTQPRWDGRDLPHGTLLVHGETGFGDMLQLVRYVPLAARRCAKVVVECQPALEALIADVAGVSQVVAQGTALPDFDAHIPLIAFPGVFDTTLDTVPWSGPYIRADPVRVQQWSALAEGQTARKRKVGLVWTGNPENLNNRERSVSLQQLGILSTTPDTTFFSLQKGGEAAKPGQVPAGMDFVDLTPQLRDFSDTAALLTQLDLVITIDTSVAHLAGALGRPTWVLLSFSADWRYHAGRSDNPWYPDMRLFRQESEGDWNGVLERLRLALAEWAVRPA